MSPTSFRRWLDEMRDAGLAASHAECARLLGRHPNVIARMKREGTDHVTALACRALVHRLAPYE